MEYVYSKDRIKYVGKKLTVLDKLVIDFLSHIDSDYVIVSGYIAILFGMDRHTEDIDIFIKPMNLKDFSSLFNKITHSEKYYCINAEGAKDAYEILNEKSSIRFAEKDTFDPNFEIKFPQNELNWYALNNSIVVDMGKSRIRISPIELQIAYKLYLGSDKDYEDAAHLYTIFRENINNKELKNFIKKLDIKTGVVKRVLKCPL